MNNPVSKAQLGHAQEGVYQCGETDQIIAAAKACGLDCQEAEIRNQDLRQFYQAYLNQFSQWPPPGPK